MTYLILMLIACAVLAFSIYHQQHFYRIIRKFNQQLARYDESDDRSMRRPETPSNNVYENYSLFKWITRLSIAAGIAITLAFSVTVIDNENIGVVKIFGETQPGYLEPGIHLAPPHSNITTHERLRRKFTIGKISDDEGEELVVLASDRNPLEVTAEFAVKLNPQYAWLIESRVGDLYFENTVRSQAMTALRDGIATFTWMQAAGESGGRKLVTDAIEKIFNDRLVDQLVLSGLTPEQAQSAFTIYPVLLQKVLPDEKIRTRVAEKTAANEDLALQTILTQKAEKEAARRTQEGLGVKNLFGALPEGFTAAEIALVTDALANKQLVEGIVKALEEGSINTVILSPGDGGETSIAIPK